MSVPRRVATLATASIVVGVLLSVPSAASAGSAARAPSGATAARDAQRSALHWTRCRSAALRTAGARCANLRVPLDYAHPSARSITLALARVRHTVPDRRYKGVMLTNAGGPGSAGRYLAGLGSQVPSDVGAAYDWIGIDPRGVGASRLSRATTATTVSTGRRTTWRRSGRPGCTGRSVTRRRARRTTERSCST
jgi:hypothetical protein